ncbi:MAG: hypothetical protein EBZ48_09620 [Proteobacteria bacterium]|nr:hypothetical protein [Pseudomonadota bacterium]
MNPYQFIQYQHSGIGTIAPFSIPAPTEAQILERFQKAFAPFYFRVYDRVQRGLLPAEAFPPRLNFGEVAVSACASDAGQFLNSLLGVFEKDDSALGRKARADALIEWRKKRRIRKFRRLPKPVFTEKDFRLDLAVNSYGMHAFAEAQVWDPRFGCDSAGNLSLSMEDTDRAIVLKSYFSRN